MKFYYGISYWKGPGGVFVIKLVISVLNDVRLRDKRLRFPTKKTKGRKKNFRCCSHEKTTAVDGFLFVGSPLRSRPELHQLPLRSADGGRLGVFQSGGRKKPGQMRSTNRTRLSGSFLGAEWWILFFSSSSSSSILLFCLGLERQACPRMSMKTSCWRDGPTGRPA